jgi:serine/arginine repetitive matrix protein 2
MYNGIGLLTPRGSGTSGHVQTNKFNLRRAPVPRFDEAPKENKEVSRQPNKDILDHNRKRQVEVKLVEYMDELEEQGCGQSMGTSSKLLDAAYAAASLANIPQCVCMSVV